MYKSPKVSLIHQDKISSTFLTTIGLKQGDVQFYTVYYLAQFYLTFIKMICPGDYLKRVDPQIL